MIRPFIRSTSVAAVFCIAALSAACGDKLLGISATINVTPANLAYGQGAVGVPQTIKVSVSNSGSAALQISAIKVATDPNNELSVGNALTTDCNGQPRSGSTSLSPGECAQFDAIWSPTAAHDAAGSFEIDSSDLQTPVVTLPVTGNAASPLLQYCVVEADGGVDPSTCSNLGVNPQLIPTVNFGTGLPNTASTEVVRITNQGQVPLTFSPAPVIDTSTPAFSIFALSGSIPGESLAPGDSADLTVTATPTANGTIKGFIDVASNDLRAPSLQIPLEIFIAGWQLCVDPSTGLDFGGVTLGQSQTLPLTVTNCGSTDFTIDQFTFTGDAPTTNQFTFALASGSTQLPSGTSTVAFPQGAKILLNVTYSPTVVRTDNAEFDYQLAVGGNALGGTIPITGHGLAAACGTSGAASPVANIVTSYGTSSNGSFTTFSPTTTPTPVVPLDYVKLNASTSTVASGTPSYTWVLVSQPSGSTTSLSGANTVQAEMQTLVSGAYVVELTVKDASGCIGTSTVTINVASKGAVHLELTWNTSCGDLDLHYSNFPATSTGSCSPSSVINNDCAYYNTSTSWGATLDHDELDGYGPENITQATPSDGSYQAWVYYFSPNSSGSGSDTCGSIIPTVNVYFNGTLSQTYTLPAGLPGYGTAWNAANITISNSGTQLVSTAGATSYIGSTSSPIGGECTSGGGD